MGAQDSVLKAVLVDVLPMDRRGTAFGVFDTAFGTFYLLGNTLMGFLYDASIPALIVFSVVAQLAALPVLVYAWKRSTKVIDVK